MLAGPVRRLAVAGTLLALPCAAQTYAVDPAQSAVTVHVGKAGLLKFAGHAHEVAATRLEGEILADRGAIGASNVTLRFEAASLRVAERGEPPEDVPQVQARMVGPDLLDVVRFPEIAFRSRSVSARETGPGVYEASVTGELSLHGVTRSLTLPVRIELTGDSLVATGQALLRQTDYGLTPVSVAGVVKVRNEVTIEFKIVARATTGVGEALPPDSSAHRR